LAEKTPPSVDPLAMWRDWIAQSERQWNSFLNNAMATDEFSQSLGRFMDVYLNLQNGMNETMTRYFSAVNMPTRTDILDLGTRLSGIEERLSGIEAAIAGSVRQQPGGTAASASPEATAVPRPPRTKRPPNA
jgi:polyhydroxyalkanoic acid synthase PhaR subunit